jgi:hypothetical protein
MEDCGMGRRQGVAAQRDLFTAGGQVPMLTSVERDKLLGLIEALLTEAIQAEPAGIREGGDEPDHA